MWRLILIIGVIVVFGLAGLVAYSIFGELVPPDGKIIVTIQPDGN